MHRYHTSFTIRLYAVLRLVKTFAIATWVGALSGFAFVFAPVAFHRIGDLHLFAELIGAVVRAIDGMGFALGAVALVSCLIAPSQRFSSLIMLCLVGMLAATACEHYLILPQMETALRAMPTIQTLSQFDPQRVAYDQLHHQSSMTYGIAVLLGYSALGLVLFDRKISIDNS